MTNCDPLNKCLACGSERLKLTLDLGTQPPANSYKDSKEEVQEEFPLAINRCEDCYHVQLTHVVNPDILYKNYLYVSGTSQTMKEHFEWFAKWSSEYQNLLYEDYFTEKFVLDIGCNDGSQLDAYKALGYHTYGIDPASNLHVISTSKGHDVTCGYFDTTFTHKPIGVGRQIMHYDILVAQNVFAHNPDPERFLRNARLVMWDSSLLFIQTSQADMILNNEFDTIYHEHISFYNINSMNELCKKSDVYLYDVIKCPLHGNSYIFIITRDPNKERPHHIANLIAMERKAGLLSEETYDKYAEKCKEKITKLYEVVELHRQQNFKVIGYGAAAKGMTYLNASGAKLDFIVDDNPLKQGKLTPGTNIPIVSSDELKKHNEPCLFIPLAWNFFDEIKEKIQKTHNQPYDRFFRLG
jgi:2-polyprenyl-3-methyl-5-hydroxy-6-metoxy-1,4-benzoquinol methylase